MKTVVPILIVTILTGCWSSTSSPQPAAVTQPQANLDPQQQPPAELPKAAAGARLLEPPIAWEPNATLTDESNVQLASVNLSIDPAPDVDEKRLATTLVNLLQSARQFEQQEDFEQAAKVRRDMLRLLENRYGVESWQARNARLALDHTQRLDNLPPADRQSLTQIAYAEQQGKLLVQHGRPEEALAHLQHAEELSRRVWGDQDFSVANLWFEQAELHKSLRRYDVAEQLYTQTIASRRALLGREHPDYVRAVDALGVLHHLQGRHANAEALLREAVALARNIWGAEHAEYATELNNLGMLYHSMQQYGVAAELLTESAHIRRQALGDQHPIYGQTLFNLGSVHYAAQDFDKAAPPLARARQIYETAVGREHPMTLLVINNLAMTELGRQNYVQAESLLYEALELVGQAVGEEHPQNAQVLHTLGILYGNQGKYSQAEPLLIKALDILQTANGPDHPAIVPTLEIYATLLRRTGRGADAERIESRARQIILRSTNRPMP